MISSRRIFHLSKWEVLRAWRKTSPKSLLASILLTGLIMAFVAVTPTSGIQVTNRLYAVGVIVGDYDEILGSETRFSTYSFNDRATALAELSSGQLDLVIGREVLYFDSQNEKSIAATTVFEEVWRENREAVLRQQRDLNPDQANMIFPVLVSVSYNEVERRIITPNEAIIIDRGIQPVESPAEREPVREQKDPSPPTSASVIPINSQVGPDVLTTPSQLAPPLPFLSTIVAVSLLVPTFFLSQMYGNGMMSEKTGAKGRMLLATPLRRFEIVAGKTLPYLIIAVVGTFAITQLQGFFIEGSTKIGVLEGGIMVLLLLPAILMFFAVSLTSVMLSRGFKEATVISVFLSTFLSLYLIAPSALPLTFPVSLVSPVTGLMQITEGGGLTIQDFLRFTIPFSILSLSIFAVAGSLISEESFFVQKRLIPKIVDGLELLISRESFIIPLGFASVFFAFSVQLMLVTLGIFFRGLGGFLLIMIASALVTETLKSIGLYALVLKGRVRRDIRSVIKLTLFSAGGFYIGEKVFLLLLAVSFLPLLNLYSETSQIGFLLFPFLLHMATSGLVSSGLIYGGQRFYPLFILLSSLLHIVFVIYIIRLMINLLGV